MDATTIALVVALMGPTTATEDTAAGWTRDGRIAYVSAVDCRAGSGILALSDRQGEGSGLTFDFDLRGQTSASAVARSLCKHFTLGR